MFEQIKDFIIFCYKAAKNMNEKSAQFAQMRQKRMEQFRAQLNPDKQKEANHLEVPKVQKEKDSASSIREPDLATNEDLNELKKLMVDLKKKVDSLVEQEEESGGDQE